MPNASDWNDFPELRYWDNGANQQRKLQRVPDVHNYYQPLLISDPDVIHFVVDYRIDHWNWRKDDRAQFNAANRDVWWVVAYVVNCIRDN